MTWGISTYVFRYNMCVGSGGVANILTTGSRPAATTRGPGVASPIEGSDSMSDDG